MSKLNCQHVAQALLGMSRFHNHHHPSGWASCVGLLALAGLALGCSNTPVGSNGATDGVASSGADEPIESSTGGVAASDGSTAGPGGTTTPLGGTDAESESFGAETGTPVEEFLGDGFTIVERLDRGVVAVTQAGGVYVGWRMFGYEYLRDEPLRVSYNVYRDGQPIANVTDSTNFLDAGGTSASAYTVAVVIDGVEGARSEPVQPWADTFLRVPLQSPGSDYSAHDASVGDADGDGQYEIYMLWQPGNAQDNSNGGVTDEVFIDALRLDGTRLWRIDLGPNIRAGEHYTQFVVIDADGDGRAELGVKTAPGTRDASGAFLSLGPASADDDEAIFRNDDGYVLTGPEYFTVFDGLTGLELATETYHAPRGNVNGWGDGYGNRVDRFLATAAYLDETGLPSFVMARGYYERTTLGAWNWRDGVLSSLWVFNSDDFPEDAQGEPFTGQGAHSLSVANADDDPQQEIIYGAMSVDHDGAGMCSTGMNHGDALHVGDFSLDHIGLEVFMPTESTNVPHWTLRDPGTCEILSQSDQMGADVGRGVAADVVAGNPGAEMWASNGVALRSATTAEVIGGPQPNSVNFLIWWDADETRELENGTRIDKIGTNGALLECDECASNNGTKSVPTLVADVLGDWREEVIWREADNSALRIYSTTDVTARRIYTLMHDPQYRVAISWQNVAYNQPPHPSFHIGDGMAEPPEPDIRVLVPADPAPMEVPVE